MQPDIDVLWAHVSNTLLLQDKPEIRHLYERSRGVLSTCHAFNCSLSYVLLLVFLRIEPASLISHVKDEVWMEKAIKQLRALAALPED